MIKPFKWINEKLEAGRPYTTAGVTSLGALAFLGMARVSMEYGADQPIMDAFQDGRLWAGSIGAAYLLTKAADMATTPMQPVERPPQDLFNAQPIPNTLPPIA